MSKLLIRLAAFSLLACSTPNLFAAAGAPLPRCAPGTKTFYLMRYIEASTNNTAPKTILDLVTLPSSGAATVTNIWDGQTAPTPSPLDGTKQAGATVAAGMNPNDGYIYAMRALGDKEAGWNTGVPWTTAWVGHTRYFEVLRYGSSGVDNLGAISNALPDMDYRVGPNFNAADFNPKTGEFIIANFRDGGALNKLYRVDVTQSPPKLAGVINLSSNIPGAQSGDFAIDASGTYAYGVAKADGTFGNSTSYRIELDSGTVTTLTTNLGIFPFGGGATLQDGSMAFYNGLSSTILNIDGTLGSSHTTTSAASADAASCLAALPGEATSTKPVPVSGWPAILAIIGVALWLGRKRSKIAGI